MTRTNVPFQREEVDGGTVSVSWVRSALLRWYRRCGRHDLPWRKADDPWHVLLAELMLQRTRADLVAPVYEETIAMFPAAADLADASAARVESALRPLGLVHRISRIQAAANAVRDGVPRRIESLMAIPGVGRYAAHATLCFAYAEPLAVVDPSVIRILDRLGLAKSDRSRPRTDPEVWAVASKLLAPRNASAWNYAMLDLGALICRERPRCAACPLRLRCPLAA